MTHPRDTTRTEGHYHVERLDDASRRLHHIEGQMEHMATRADVTALQGQMEHMATKEDVANAKFVMFSTYVAMGIMVIAAIVTVAARIWPS